jgi:hypothetical protein
MTISGVVVSTCHHLHCVSLLFALFTTANDQRPPKHQKLQHDPAEQLTQSMVKLNLFELKLDSKLYGKELHLFQYQLDIVPSRRQIRVNGNNELARDGEGKVMWETKPWAAQQEMLDDTKPRAEDNQPAVALQKQLMGQDMDSTPLKRRIIDALTKAPHYLKVVSDGTNMLFSGEELELEKPSSLYDFEVQVKASCGM